MRVNFGRKITSAGLAVSLALGASIGAFAYWTAPGSGSGKVSTVNNPVRYTLIQDSTLTSLQPGTTTPQTITGHVELPSGSTYIGTITPSVASVTESPTEIALWGDPVRQTAGSLGTYYCSAADYIVAPNVYNSEAVPGGTGTTSNSINFGTIVFNDMAHNQDA